MFPYLFNSFHTAKMVQSDIDQSRVTAGLFGSGMDVTPEKLTMLNIKAHDHDHDTRSEMGGISQFPRHAGLRNSNARRTSGAHSVVGGGSKLASRSRMLTTSGSRRQSSYLANHRSRMSADLTSQAESKFTSLMEVMTSATREASSFKEFWLALMADRESFDREREELMLRIDEYEESERLRLDEHDDRDNELRSAKDEHDRLLAIIAIRNNTTNDHEKTIVERDHELVSCSEIYLATSIG
jgi:hypothetical protein